MRRIGRLGRVGILAVLAAALAGGGAPPPPVPCGFPDEQPEQVFGVYLTQLSEAFPLDEASCAKLVKNAIGACHRAVSDSASCLDHVVGGLFKGTKIACGSSVDPAACVDSAKQDSEDARAGFDERSAVGHALCDGEFAEAIATACAGMPL